MMRTGLRISRRSKICKCHGLAGTSSKSTQCKADRSSAGVSSDGANKRIYNNLDIVRELQDES